MTQLFVTWNTFFPRRHLENTSISSEERIIPDQQISTEENLPPAARIDVDIAHYLQMKLGEDEMYHILKHHFNPPIGYKFPFTKFGQKQRCFQFSWLKRYPGLVYSPSTNGAFCLYCFLFCGIEKKLNQVLLVHKPFINWKKATERFDEHFHNIRHNSGNNSYSSHKKTGTGFEDHMICVTKYSNFKRCMEGKQISVMDHIDNAAEERKLKNLKILETIVETVLLCGRQNIAFRGHRDDSKAFSDPCINSGNFKALIQYRVNGGDTDFGNHLSNGPRNASYTSKTTQNEIIEIIGQNILQRIVFDCNSSGGFFSVSADEARDVSNKEQLAVIIRYVDQVGEVREHFLAFLNVSEGTTGEILSKEILDLIENVGLDPKKIRSQCYDGAGNMAGKIRGVGARIQKLYPKALPFWCAAHQLNTCIVHACRIPSVQSMMSTADQVVRFFEFSPKKQVTLEKAVEKLECFQYSKQKLKELCRTRWVERHDAFDVFINLLPAIVEALETYAVLPNTRTPGTADATSLLNSIANFEFLVCLIIVHQCLAFLKGLSKSLQERSLDIVKALANVRLVTTTLEECRNNAEICHRNWHEKAMDIARIIDVPVSKPRTCRRQTLRDNVPSEGPEDFFRKTITVPFLDHLLWEVKSRFTTLHQHAAMGLMLVPSELDTPINLDHLLEFFMEDIPSPSSFDAEMLQWNAYWKDQRERPTTISATLKAVDPLFFQNITAILKICGTFPVTSCECERSISVLRRLKTYLRSTMGQDRLTALALMYIHRTMDIDVKKIVAEFARKHPRKMKLPNILFEDE